MFIYKSTGAWPYVLNKKFSRLVAKGVNCQYMTRGNSELWIKSKCAISANEELLIQYHNNPLQYWAGFYTPGELTRLTEAMASATDDNVDEVIRTFQYDP